MEVTNRFKELDLIGIVPEEIWTEIRNTAHEALTKTIPKKKKCRKAKRLSEEALQIAEQRRKAEGKGERERYTQLNAEFQGTARRDKKAFLSEQCKEIEESNRVGKTRDLQENWRYQGNVSCRDGFDKGQKQQGPNRSRRDYEEVARMPRRAIQKRS